MTPRSLLLAALIAAAPLPVLAQSAKDVHRDAIVLDSHFDTPVLLSRPGWDIMERHSPELDGSQVDYPRMVEGGVDGGFFAVFTPQGQRGPQGEVAAREAALVRLTEIREMIARHGDKFTLALTVEEAAAAVAAKKRFVVISMENSYSIGRDLSLIGTFHRLGVRVMGPVHGSNNQLADSSTDRKGPEWSGLSPLGRQFVDEANRLGILIDGSHASDETLRQLVVYSKAPIILTHSGVQAVFDHPRNVNDTLLRLVANSGGVVQINVFSNYMVEVPPNPERSAALVELERRSVARTSRTQAQQIVYMREWAEIEARFPSPRATIVDVMEHIFHAVKTVGIDHVGLSGDFDGGGGVDGLNDVTAYPEITKRLLDAGFTAEDVAKFWGGNALRVLQRAQEIGEALAQRQ